MRIFYTTCETRPISSERSSRQTAFTNPRHAGRLPFADPAELAFKNTTARAARSASESAPWVPLEAHHHRPHGTESPPRDDAGQVVTSKLLRITHRKWRSYRLVN